MPRVYVTAVAVTLALAASVGDARAEIIFLTSGRTLSVKSHEYKGDSIVLTLRSGAEVTCDRSLVEKVLPDEVPYPEPVAPAPADQQGPETGGLLEATPY